MSTGAKKVIRRAFYDWVIGWNEGALSRHTRDAASARRMVERWKDRAGRPVVKARSSTARSETP